MLSISILYLQCCLYPGAGVCSTVCCLSAGVHLLVQGVNGCSSGMLMLYPHDHPDDIWSGGRGWDWTRNRLLHSFPWPGDHRCTQPRP